MEALRQANQRLRQLEQFETERVAEALSTCWEGRSSWEYAKTSMGGEVGEGGRSATVRPQGWRTDTSAGIGLTDLGPESAPLAPPPPSIGVTSPVLGPSQLAPPHRLGPLAPFCRPGLSFKRRTPAFASVCRHCVCAFAIVRDDLLGALQVVTGVGPYLYRLPRGVRGGADRAYFPLCLAIESRPSPHHGF